MLSGIEQGRLTGPQTVANERVKPNQNGDVRVGGDTCASATVIPALPYSDTGNTCSFIHDYDEVCPYSGSLSPDVAYSFTPGDSGNINISLCNAGTDYDTKLYVYTGGCPGTLVACNDDACPGYVSQLMGVGVTAGETYYIIIDGYGSACGNYEMTVDWAEPPPDCPPDSLFSQRTHLPSDGWSAATSDLAAGYLVAENFSVTGQICDVHWWGLDLQYSAGWYECDDLDAQFQITFYYDAAGQPGAVACQYTVTPIRTNTGLFYDAYEWIYYEVPSLSPCCTLTDGWVSIQDVDGDACWFLWMSSAFGNFDSLQLAAGVWGSTGYDRALCLTGEYIPTFGACCDDSTGICTDNVEQINCLPPLRFTANTLCADLDPACGEITGACCYGDGTCDITTQAGCTGDWLGANTTCDQCPCIVICPAGAVQETEPCGAMMNDGCNMDPNTFEPIVCDVPVCGTIQTNTSTRDTDWFEITVPTGTIFTFSVEAEFDVVFGLIEQYTLGVPGCANITGYISPYALAGPCVPAAVTTDCLPPGTYYFFVSHQDWPDFPCGAGNDYVATLTCTPCEIPTGACCLPDGTCVEVIEEECAGFYFGDNTLCADVSCLGACCFADGTCQDLSENDCAAAGGTFQGVGTDCATTTCPIVGPGDSCANPLVVTLGVADLPYVNTNYTCGRGNLHDDLSNLTCMYYYDGGEEIIYQLDITEPMVVTLTLDPKGTTWTGMAIDDECPPGVSCIGYVRTSVGTPKSIECVSLAPGTYYVMVDTWPTPNCIPDFDLTITQCIPCDVICPPGATPEGEDCGSDTNGGCNSDPNVFGSLACGETVCGLGWATGGTRDTDWYEIVITEDSILTLTAQAEFDAVFGFLEQITPGLPGCANMTGYISPYILVADCVEGSVSSVCLPAGTYYAFMGPSVYEGFPCGTFNEYYMTLTCEPCTVPPGACCLDDGTCQDVADQAACDALGGVFKGAGTDCATTVCVTPEGNDCTQPLTFTLPDDGFPYVSTNTTCGRVNDYSNTCLGSYDGGEDIIYELTVTEEICIKIAVDGVLTWVGVAIDDECPPAASGCIAYATSSAGDPVIGNVPLLPGTYYIMIDTWPSPDCTDFTMTITTCPEPPPNDDCVDAEPLAVPGEVIVDHTAATDDPESTATCVTGSLNQAVWYVVVGDGTTFTATTCNAGGSYSDTKIQVWCGPCDALHCVTGNDDSTCAISGLRSTVTWCTLPGAEYLIAIGGYAANMGVIDLTVVSDGVDCTGADPECGGLCGDFEPDGDVDTDDYYAFLDAFGTCVGDLKYLPEADFDGDNCITLIDYQAFVQCYRDANPGARVPFRQPPKLGGGDPRQQGGEPGGVPLP